MAVSNKKVRKMTESRSTESMILQRDLRWGLETTSENGSCEIAQADICGVDRRRLAITKA